MFGGVWHQGEAGGVQYGGGPTCTAETRGRPVQCSIALELGVKSNSYLLLVAAKPWYNFPNGLQLNQVNITSQCKVKGSNEDNYLKKTVWRDGTLVLSLIECHQHLEF